MSVANSSFDLKLGTVTIFFSKKNWLPPVYITSSMSDWTLQEMSHTVDEGKDSSFTFSRKFHKVPEGLHQYKFRRGPNSEHYAINDRADVGTYEIPSHESTVAESIIEMDNNGGLINVINVKYGSSTGLVTHWGPSSVDSSSVRVVDAEITSASASGDAIETLEHAAVSVQQHAMNLEDLKHAEVSQVIGGLPNTGAVIRNDAVHAHAISASETLHSVLPSETNVDNGTLSMTQAGIGSGTIQTEGKIHHVALALDMNQQRPKTFEPHLETRSTTLYWDTITSPSGEVLLGVDNDEAPKEMNKVDKKKRGVHAKHSSGYGRRTMDRRWISMQSARNASGMAQLFALWLAVAVVVGAFAAVIAWYAWATQDVELVHEL